MLPPKTVQKLRSFSTPLEATNHKLFDVIVQNFAKDTLRLFLEKHKTELLLSSPNLLKFLLKNLEFKKDLDWYHPSMGLPYRNLFQNPSISPIEVASNIALHLIWLGLEGMFVVNSPKPMNLLFANHYLPDIKNIEVSASENKVAIILENNTHKFSYKYNLLLETFTESNRPEPMGPTTNNFVAWHKFIHGGSPGHTVTDSKPTMAAVLKLSEEAIDLLSENAPPFALWVRKAVKYIIPLYSSSRDLMYSGSTGYQFSTIQLSAPKGPMEMAEMLVHESSHQFLHVLNLLGPLSDGSDKKTYFSPVVKKQRPLEKILLAYHAFANVLLLYRECSNKNTKDNGYISRSEAPLIEELKILQTPLEGRNASGATDDP